MESFGLGFVAALPSGANPTPIPFGILEGITVDHSIEYKKYRGQYGYPKIVATGAKDLGGKVDSMSVFGAAVAQFTGATATSGKVLPAINETASIPAPSGPYTITVSHSATFVQEYGVLDLTAGAYLKCVAGPTPTTGQYAVAAGVFTFAAADTGHKIAITYTYTVSATGQTLAFTNTPMSIATGVQLVCFDPGVGGKVVGVKVLNAFFPKLGLALKAEDLAKQSMDWFAADDGTLSVASLYLGE